MVGLHPMPFEDLARGSALAKENMRRRNVSILSVHLRGSEQFTMFPTNCAVIVGAKWWCFHQLRSLAATKTHTPFLPPPTHIGDVIVSKKLASEIWGCLSLRDHLAYPNRSGDAWRLSTNFQVKKFSTPEGKGNLLCKGTDTQRINIWRQVQCTYYQHWELGAEAEVEPEVGWRGDTVYRATLTRPIPHKWFKLRNH